MGALTFLIAVVALILAIMAYRRTTAPREWETQMDAMREKTADALSRMEKSIRKEEKGDIVEPSEG
jgi:hypothetical protein